MRQLLDTRDQMLAGGITGRKALARLVERTNTNPDQPEEIYLDFGGVDLATASFLREAVFGFRDAIRRDRPNYYPVVANVNELVEDELKVLLGSRGDALLVCALDGNGKPSYPRLLGDLEAKQKATFDLVQRGETDAAQLMKEHGEAEGVKQTAFNNRLASLAVLGLIKEVTEGRTKRYGPLLTGR
jgi:STAS-like domain of unknown function (DUF4325)